VAAGLTDAALPKGNCAVRIMLFVGGPTTEGGGQVVDKELSEPIRSHKARSLSLLTLGTPKLDLLQSVSMRPVATLLSVDSSAC